MSQDRPSSSEPVTTNNPQDERATGEPVDFHARLNKAAGEVSYRKLGKLTDTHPETVRRYMQGQAPSATFLTNMCRVLGISGEWLLTGRGPMKCAQMRSHALNQADPSELMTAVANTLTDLCDRLDRVERYVQTLETRLRGSAGGHGDSENTKASIGKPKATKLAPNDGTLSPGSYTHLQATSGGGAHEQSANSIEPKPAGSAPAKPAGTSAQRIRNAIAKRPS